MLKDRKFFVFSMIVVFILLGKGLGYSFDATQLQQLKATKLCRFCDLSFANLAGGIDLSLSQIPGANLFGANLVGINLSRAVLSDVNLFGANLTNANLSGAMLRNVNLTHANIYGTNFTNADLGNAIWIDGSRCKPAVSFGTCTTK